MPFYYLFTISVFCLCRGGSPWGDAFHLLSVCSVCLCPVSAPDMKKCHENNSYFCVQQNWYGFLLISKPFNHRGSPSRRFMNITVLSALGTEQIRMETTPAISQWQVILTGWFTVIAFFTVLVLFFHIHFKTKWLHFK